MLSSTLIGTTQLPSAEAVPVLAQRTWGFAEGNHDRDQEISACVLVSNSAGSRVSAAFSEAAA